MSEKKKKRTSEDSAFREWLSDNLRYLVLIIAILLIIVVIVMVTALLKQRREDKNDPLAETGPDITIMSERVTETESPETARVTERQTETAKVTGKQTETAKVTEKQTETAKAAGKQTETAKAAGKQTETAKVTEKQTAKATEKQTEKAAGKQTEAATSLAGIGTTDLDQLLPEETAESTAPSAKKTTILASGSSSVSGNTSSVTNIDTGKSAGNYTGTVQQSSSSSSVSDSGEEKAVSSGVSDSGTAQEETAEPVYETPETPAPQEATIVSACYIRSNPDYGDNVIGECYGGETVAYYGIEEGWAKIELNGIVGYVGPKFVG